MIVVIYGHYSIPSKNWSKMADFEGTRGHWRSLLGHIFAIFDHFPSILVSLYAFIHDLYVSQSEKNEFREYKSDKSSVLINKQKNFCTF